MNSTLYQFGFVQFTVFPLNVSEVNHLTQTDWARKEIAGAPIFREWVGEGDEEISLRGKTFPHFFGLNYAGSMGRGRTTYQQGTGMGQLDVLDEMRRYGQGHLLIRGDGIKLGWYVIEKLSRGHSNLASDGIGQQVEFDATFMRVPVNDPNFYYTDTTSFISRMTGAGR